MRSAVWLFLPSLALAQSARYNDPAPAGARTPLVATVEKLVTQLSAKDRRPEVDSRLEAAAAQLADKLPDDAPPTSDLVQQSLWLNGIVEPPPHLVVVSVEGRATDGAPAALLDELKQKLPSVLASGNYCRQGVGVAVRGDEARLVIALQESFVEMEPFPRALPTSGAAIVRGKLRAPFRHPAVFVTAPEGLVTRVTVAGSNGEFEGQFRCVQKGRHQLEVTGEDRFGPTVLANFPVHCGVAPPSVLQPPPVEKPEMVADAAAAEAEIVRLVNADRASHGLYSLRPEPRLAAVARAHSGDMLKSRFFGHVSPSTGSAADRVRKAGLEANVVLENVARAYSPREVERGLMASPGHRANLLSREATHVGVGVVLGAVSEGNLRELYTTQLFVRPPEKLPSHPLEELRRRVDDFRLKQSLQPLVTDMALDKIAADTARALARGALAPDRAGDPVTEKLGTLAARYKSVRSAVAVAGGLGSAVESLAQALGDKGAGAVGLGLATGPRSGADHTTAVFVVALVATKR